MSIATQTYRGFGGSGGVDARVRRGFAAYTGLPQPPITGYQYETYAGSGAGLWLGSGSSPAVVVGDVFIAQLVTSPNGFQVQINSDGTIDIFAGGNTSRQELLYAIYRVAGNVIDPPTFPSSTGIVWINEVGPVWNSALILPNFTSGPIVVGTAITVTLQSSLYAVSPEGDPLTFSIASGSLPAGLSILSGQIVGTPTNAVTTFFTLSATDITGTSMVSPQGSISVQALPPPPVQGMMSFVGLEYFQALVALRDNGFLATTPNEVNVSQGPLTQAGYVIAQSPSPGAPYVAGCPVQFTVNRAGKLPSTAQNEPIPYWYFLQR